METTDNTTPEYQAAVDAFNAAHSKYKDAEERFLNGDYLLDIISDSVNAGPEHILDQHREYVQILKDLLEDRNAKLDEAGRALRRAVKGSEQQQRGPEGKADTLSYGPLKATTATKRWLDPKSLFRGCQKHGLMESLLHLKKLDKDGKEVSLVQQTWTIDYEGVYTWLKANKLQDVIRIAYDEMEQTPRVSGAKSLAFLGEPKKES
jgi:hypothetical protein